MLVIQLRPNCTSFWISSPLFQGSFLSFKNSNLSSAGGFFFLHWFSLYGFLYSLVQGSSIPRLTWSTNVPERGLYLLSSSFKAICNTPHPSFFRRRYRAPMNKVLFSVIFSYYLFLNWSFLPQRVPSLRSLYGSISLAMVFFISVFFSHDSNWFSFLNWMNCPSMDICFSLCFHRTICCESFFMIF